MTSEHREDAQCLACKLVLEPRPQSDCETYFACPGCGVGDSAENILAECAEYAKEQGARYLQAVMRKNFGGGGMFKLTQHPIPERRYRFFVDVNRHLPAV